MKSINPATGELVKEYAPHSEAQIASALAGAQECYASWRNRPFSERAFLMNRAAVALRARKDELALLIAQEMGKVLKDGAAEIEKCAGVCEYYAQHAEAMLKDEPIASDAKLSFITYQPIGIILAVMPWNFPFWQVFRFAAPNLMAGNVGVLKHASNVSGCALAIEAIFREAGFPPGCFTTLLMPGDAVEHLIEDKAIAAVTLTGSSEAGRSVAAAAGKALKKSVLELGGSDAYVVLADADIAKAAEECAKSRLINAGQSCIAAKRFIVLSSVFKRFETYFIDAFKLVRSGDPQNACTQLGPMARTDLRDALHEQVMRSVEAGAVLRLGGVIPAGNGAFYPATVLTKVTPGMPAFDEELFGPVAALIEAQNEEEAFALANHTSFGLGSAIFTSDIERGTMLARTHIDAGQTFVNAFVRSDARLPFGGTKESGYGRELSKLGIREFVNAKTVYVA